MSARAQFMLADGAFGLRKGCGIRLNHRQSPNASLTRTHWPVLGDPYFTDKLTAACFSVSQLRARKCLHAWGRQACWKRCKRLRAMDEIDQLSEFLQKLTPLSRSCLLSELERLE